MALDAGPALLGILAEVGTLAWLTFGGPDVGTVDTGLIALIPHLVVTFSTQAVVRVRRRRAPAEASRRAAEPSVPADRAVG
jgi:SSS family solute:Na+ symporter